MIAFESERDDMLLSVFERSMHADFVKAHKLLYTHTHSLIRSETHTHTHTYIHTLTHLSLAEE